MDWENNAPFMGDRRNSRTFCLKIIGKRHSGE
jgi:hypothetical protein